MTLLQYDWEMIHKGLGRREGLIYLTLIPFFVFAGSMANILMMSSMIFSSYFRLRFQEKKDRQFTRSLPIPPYQQIISSLVLDGAAVLASCVVALLVGSVAQHFFGWEQEPFLQAFLNGMSVFLIFVSIRNLLFLAFKSKTAYTISSGVMGGSMGMTINLFRSGPLQTAVPIELFLGILIVVILINTGIAMTVPEVKE